MKLLDRYLLKVFSKNLLLILATFTAVYLLVEFFESMDNFIETKQPMGLAITYFLLKIPFIVEQLMPISILLAGVITLGLLNHHLELIALKAAGIPTTRIVRPIVIGGILFVGLTLAMCQWLLPVTISTTNKIWYEEVKKGMPKGTIIRKGRFYYRGTQGFYSFERPVLTANDFLNFSYAAWDDAYDLNMLLQAETATWQDGQWNFSQGQIKKRTENNGYVVEIFDRTALQLPEDPSHLFVPKYKFDEMSFSELFIRARHAAALEDDTAWLAFHKKLSYNLLGLPLLLLGLPMLLLVHQRWGRDLALAVPASCFLAFLSWVGWGTMQSMAKTAYITPAVASWAVHFLIGSLGVFFLNRQDR
jgi:lipopolysaccharide export system permease protein